MGYDARLCVLVGYTLTHDQLRVHTLTPGCSHKPPKGANFCSVCGARVGLRAEEMQVLEEGSYDGFEVVSYGFSEAETKFAAGRLSSWRDVSKHKSGLLLADLPENLQDYAEELKGKLAEEGVEVDVVDFGVFAIAYESC
jgi:hypothetical protein